MTYDMRKIALKEHFSMLLDDAATPINKEAHQDDFYVFTYVEKGEIALQVNFETYHLTDNTLFITLPGQIHSFQPITTDVKRITLLVDTLYIEDMYKHIFEKFAITASPVSVPIANIVELKSLSHILSDRLQMLYIHEELGKNLVFSLTQSLVGVMADILLGCNTVRGTSKRHIELTLKFKDMLRKHLPSHKNVSFYAELLHISSGYLNEVVKQTTGMSSIQYIQFEIILIAKKLLCFTTLSIQEIAHQLKYEDTAYFTRLFTKTVGISPKLFRIKNRD